MNFSSPPKTELDKFFEVKRYYPNSEPLKIHPIREQVFENEYGLIAKKLLSELEILDEHILWGDKLTFTPRADLIDVLKGVCRGYFYYVSNLPYIRTDKEISKEDLPCEKLKTFAQGLVNVSLAMIQIERPKSFSKEVTRILTPISTAFRKLLKGDRSRINQHLDIQTNLSKTGLDYLWNPEKLVNAKLETAGNALVSLKYINWNYQQKTELLYLGYSQLKKLLDAEIRHLTSDEKKGVTTPSQHLINCLIGELGASGYKLDGNPKGWIKRMHSYTKDHPNEPKPVRFIIE